MSNPTDLVFVTYTSAPKVASRNQATKNLIRKQALKAFYSPQGSDLSAERQRVSNAVDKRSRKKHMNRFRLAKDQTQTKDVALPKYVSAFEPIVTELGPDAWALLDYFRHAFRMKSMSIHDTKEWFAFAMYKSSISQATLCLVSLNRDLEQGITVSAVTLHHRAAAMKLLKEEIEGDTGVSKEIVAGTVALLAIAEDLEGNLVNSDMHMDGLMKLVGICGGLKGFGESQAMVRLIAWADLCHSGTWLAEPRLPRLFEEEAIRKVQDLPWASYPKNLHLDPKLRSDLETLTCPHLRALTEILHSFPDCPPTDTCPPEARKRVAQMMHVVEQLMINLRTRIPYEGKVTALSRAFICAAQLYVAVGMRRLPLRSHMVLLLTNQMLDDVQTYDLRAIPEGEHESWNLLVLWIQCIGLLSLEDHDGEGKLKGAMLETVRILGIEDEKQLRDRLAEVAWMSTEIDDRIAEVFRNGRK